MYKWILVFLLSLLSLNTHAIQATLEGDKLYWYDAQPGGGKDLYVPTLWNNTFTNMPFTNKWLPGGLVNSVPKTLTLFLSGKPGADSVTVGFEVVGYEYRVASPFSAGATNTHFTTCTVSSFSPPIARVMDGPIGCLANQYLESGANFYRPFTESRPIYRIDADSLSRLFAGKPAGDYVGTVPSTYQIYYFGNGGSIGAYHMTDIAALIIKYRPSYLTNVDLTGNNSLAPRYDFSRNVVSGETTFHGVATGLFTNGLKLGLKPGRTDYAMKGPNNTSIQYGIECLGCANSELVKPDGGVATFNTTIAGTGSAISFGIRVHFQDADLNLIESGTYNDVFYLLFEPNL